MLAATADPGLLSLLAVILGGGLVSAYVAAKRAPAQNELDSVQAMKVVMGELREELARANEKYDRLVKAMDALEADRDTWRSRALKAEGLAT